jgi:hypothetical protein
MSGRPGTSLTECPSPDWPVSRPGSHAGAVGLRSPDHTPDYSRNVNVPASITTPDGVVVRNIAEPSATHMDTVSSSPG